jgi:hypothetical protein
MGSWKGSTASMSRREEEPVQFYTIDEYVRWHNKIKPHLSLDFENLKTPIQAFHRKRPLEKEVSPVEIGVK